MLRCLFSSISAQGGSRAPVAWVLTQLLTMLCVLGCAALHCAGLIFVAYCVVCYLVTALLFSLLILDLAALVITVAPSKAIFKYTDLVYTGAHGGTHSLASSTVSLLSTHSLAASRACVFSSRSDHNRRELQRGIGQKAGCDLWSAW